jgi:prevent-host-death family protein
VSVAEAKARFSELVAAAQAGDEVVITKRGRPVVHLVAVEPARQPVDLSWLRSRTEGMAESSDDSVALIRRMRDDARY